MADETIEPKSASAVAESDLADEMAFALRYSMPQYNGKPEKAAEAAGLPKEKGMEFLQRPSVLASIKAIRKAYGAAMPDEVDVMKGLLAIAESYEAKDADRIKAWTAYSELYAQTVRGRAKDGDEKPLGTVNNIQQNNFYSLDAAEELVRAGKLSPEDAAKIGCRQVADVKKVTERLKGDVDLLPAPIKKVFDTLTIDVPELKKDGTEKKKPGPKHKLTPEEKLENRRRINRICVKRFKDKKRAEKLEAEQRAKDEIKARMLENVRPSSI